MGGGKGTDYTSYYKLRCMFYKGDLLFNHFNLSEPLHYNHRNRVDSCVGLRAALERRGVSSCDARLAARALALGSGKGGLALRNAREGRLDS
eukprot:6731496-Pyramimonas_sp.AAC.1